MFVRIEGNGPPILLLHGWATSGRIFDSVAAGLSQRHTCHVADLPGHGRSDDGQPAPTFDAMASAVGAYLAQLDVPVVMVGWALGATLGLRVAADHPDSCRGLVCVSTVTPGGLSDVVGQMVERMRKDWPRFARSSVDRMVGDRVSDEQRQFLTDLVTATPLTTASRTLLDVATQDPAAWVDAVRVPVLFVHGSDDNISPLEGVQALASVMVHAAVQVYAGIGHAPPVEDPDQLTEDIERFVEGLV